MPLYHPKEKEKKRKIKIVSVQASHNILALTDFYRAISNTCSRIMGVYKT